MNIVLYANTEYLKLDMNANLKFQYPQLLEQKNYTNVAINNIKIIY
jgi:hypothetical protein